VDDLHGSGIIPGTINEMLFSWSMSESDEDIASVRAQVTSRTASKIVVCLKYSVTLDDESREVSETVSVVKANQTGSGKWYFRCPAEADGEPCTRRARILYLPPDEEYFACRCCHNLAYSKPPGEGQAEGDRQDDVGGEQIEDKVLEPQDMPGKSEHTEDRPYTNESDIAPPPLRSFFYIDHTIKLLDPGNTTIREEGRVKIVGELLSKLIREEALSEERFSEAISEVQSLAPEAFAAYAAKALRDGNFSVGSEELLVYFHLHRLGRILRLHLAEDLQVTGAADLLLLDTAIAAFVQTRILLTRATPLSPENGISLKEEKLLRSQAIAQQKIFLSAMDKLQPKPARPQGRPPAKKKTG
jgi:hypothetical protein